MCEHFGLFALTTLASKFDKGDIWLLRDDGLVVVNEAPVVEPPYPIRSAAVFGLNGASPYPMLCRR